MGYNTAPMFRDDGAALAEQNEQLRREVERLRVENVAMRGALVHHRIGVSRAYMLKSVYELGGAGLTDGERVAFARHELRSFPVWAAMLLHVVTFGLWSLVHFGRMHGQLPKLREDDPTAARAILVFFVPYVGLWWSFFAPMRLVDRINLQYALRGREPPLTKGPVVAAGALNFLFYFIPLAWLYAIWKTQRAVNELVAMGPAVPVEAAAPSAAFTGVRVGAEELFGHVPPAVAEAAEEAAARGDGRAAGRW